MSGSLLCEYVLSQKKEKAGSLPADGAVVNLSLQQTLSMRSRRLTM